MLFLKNSNNQKKKLRSLKNLKKSKKYLGMYRPKS